MSIEPSDGSNVDEASPDESSEGIYLETPEEEEERWNRIYESLVDEWIENHDRPPSEHPYIRYYCGYVEPSYRKLDLPEYKRLAGFFMQEPLDLTLEDIDYTELHGIDWIDRFSIPRFDDLDPELFDVRRKPQTLQTLWDYNLDLWSHAVCQNLINYSLISDSDKEYIDECINKHSRSFILRFYVHHAYRDTYDRVYAKVSDSLNRNYMKLLSGKDPSGISPSDIGSVYKWLYEMLPLVIND